MTEFEIRQFQTIGQLAEELYFTNRIGIEVVRGILTKRRRGASEQRALTEQLEIEKAMSAVMRRILQAGIGENGSFEGVAR